MSADDPVEEFRQREAAQEGESIRHVRELIGWSQAELATRAGTTQQTVDRIERGETKHSRALPRIRETLLRHGSRRETDRQHENSRPTPYGIRRSYLPAGHAICPVFQLTYGRVKFSYCGTYASPNPPQFMIMVYSDDYPDFPPITGLVVTTADEPFKPGDTVIYYSKEGHFTEPQVPGEEIEIGRVVSIEGDTVVIQYLGKQSEGDADLAPETCDRRFWQISRVIEILHARRPPRRNPKPG